MVESFGSSDRWFAWKVLRRVRSDARSWVSSHSAARSLHWVRLDFPGWHRLNSPAGGSPGRCFAGFGRTRAAGPILIRPLAGSFAPRIGLSRWLRLFRSVRCYAGFACSAGFAWILALRVRSDSVERTSSNLSTNWLGIPPVPGWARHRPTRSRARPPIMSALPLWPADETANGAWPLVTTV